MSRHNAQLRAAASAYENAEPEGVDDEAWERAVEATAAAMGHKVASDLIQSITDAADELRRIVGPGHAWHPLRDLTNCAEFYRARVQSRYDELIANGGRP